VREGLAITKIPKIPSVWSKITAPKARRSAAARAPTGGLTEAVAAGKRHDVNVEFPLRELFHRLAGQIRPLLGTVERWKLGAAMAYKCAQADHRPKNILHEKYTGIFGVKKRKEIK
jgi:hypothetical protein